MQLLLQAYDKVRYIKLNPDICSPIKELPAIVLMPFCRNLESISLIITEMSLNRRAVAMPEPIRPPPMTATFLIFLGFNPTSVTLGTYPKQSMYSEGCVHQ